MLHLSRKQHSISLSKPTKTKTLSEVLEGLFLNCSLLHI